MEKCRTVDPDMISLQTGHRAACHLLTEEAIHVATV
jgi:hypothetical protein